jgi:hypothetical protein
LQLDAVQDQEKMEISRGKSGVLPGGMGAPAMV